MEEGSSNKSKNIYKGKTTYRTVKAIQSKIYQIKSTVERENKYINDKISRFDSKSLKESYTETLKNHQQVTEIIKI